MRTAGIRSVPQPVPRPDASDNPQPSQPPKPLPRTKFLQKSASEESPAPVTLRSPPAPPVQSKCISTTTPTPPPKPPRTPSLRNSPNKDTSSQPRRSGLIEVLSRANTASPTLPTSRTQRQATSALKPVRPAPQGRGADQLAAVSTRRNQRPVLQPLSLPSPPKGIPPIPSSSATPRVPTRPSPAQLAASRTPARPSDRGRSPPSLTVGLRTNRNLQGPVCSIEDFEDSCKEVFRSTKKAKELSARGKHMQAASHFQKALTALDRVLRAQVLSLSQHEPTRQRLFLLQQEVFSLRKEALNGFTDAQTAVRTPPGLAPTPATPGAPPSYDDVLKEDSRLLQDGHPHPPRELSTQSTISSPSLLTPTGQGSRPHTRPVTTQSPANNRQSVRVRSHSSGDPEMEELVNMRGTRSGEPTTAPPSTHQRSLFKSTLISATRPKSSYHPLSQPNSLLLPSPTVSSTSLPPPLLPVSLSLASLPTQSSGATSLEAQPHPSPRPTSVVDEAVLSQMKVLHKYKSNKSSNALADTSASYIQKEPLPPIPLNKDNMEEWKRKEEIISNDSGQPLLENIEKISRNTVQLKDKAKSNPVPFVSPVDDPFLSLDPFPLVKPQSGNSNELFTEETLGAHSLPVVSVTHQNHNQTPSDDSAHESSQTSDQKDSFSFSATQDLLKTQPGIAQNPPVNLGDSILEALDFAITPVSNHKKVSPQHSWEKKRTRSHSEENLLDSSYNTFETMLLSTKDRQASRASIIEEFDPLMVSHVPQDHIEDVEKREDELHEHKGRDVLREERETKGSVPPEPTPRTTVDTNNVSSKNKEAAKEEGETDIFGSPVYYFAEGGAVALEEQAGVDEYTSRYSGAYALSYGGKGKSYSSSEDTSSMHSWPPDYSARIPSDPASPMYPSLYPEEEEEQEEAKGSNFGVGRSAFYIPPTIQDEVKRRNLLSIREGVKIYFIHTDGIVTSPWNRPFLAVSRDLSKDKSFSTGLVVSVGNNLWTCELQRKSTLVLRTQTGSYVFNEVAGRPECKAVAIRVPSGVRRVQHELLSNILQQNTLLEEERPKGITKAISKGATSAATRMTRLVEDKSVTPSQTFVRRNSIRALKGVTKRLTSIAEKTGGTLKELPEEYQALQEAADTLAFAHSAKMIQYV